MLPPKLSDFLLDLYQSLAHQGLAKSLDISIGMPAFFANLAASRSVHISSQKIAQLRFHKYFYFLPTSPHHLQAGERAFANATFSSNLANVTAALPCLLECERLLCVLMKQGAFLIQKLWIQIQMI